MLSVYHSREPAFLLFITLPYMLYKLFIKTPCSEKVNHSFFGMLEYGFYFHSVNRASSSSTSYPSIHCTFQVWKWFCLSMLKLTYKQNKP